MVAFSLSKMKINICNYCSNPLPTTLLCSLGIRSYANRYLGELSLLASPMYNRITSASPCSSLTNSPLRVIPHWRVAVERRSEGTVIP